MTGAHDGNTVGMLRQSVEGPDLAAPLGDGVSPVPITDVRYPLLLQTWESVGFVHWAYEPDAVRLAVPDGLDLDLFDGMAWVSLTPFAVESRFPIVPTPPGLHSYHETNLRTYVRGPDGRRGIWFFALDCGSLGACALGRSAFFQPYHRADLAVDRLTDGTVHYRGTRRFPTAGAGYDVVIEPAIEALAPDLGDLDQFLTGRWLLYSFYGPVPAVAAVEHEPWPLQRASVVSIEEDVTESAGLPPSGPPALAHYGEAVHARLGAPRPIIRERRRRR